MFRLMPESAKTLIYLAAAIAAAGLAALVAQLFGWF